MASILPRLALSVMLFGVACRGGEPAGTWAPEKPAVDAPAIHLLDHLQTAGYEGLVKTLVTASHSPPEKVLLTADFEDGGLGPFTAWGGPGADPARTAAAVTVVSGAQALGGGKSAQLTGGLAHGLSLRSRAMPVAPTETYVLSYQMAGEQIRVSRDATYGEARVELYQLSPDEAGRADELLADPAAAASRLVAPPADFWVPGRYGTSPWKGETTRFGTGPSATHMVLRLDLSQSSKEGEPHRSGGTAWFDDVRLTAIHQPLQLRYQPADAGLGDAHPLKVVLEKAHPGHPKGTEARMGIYAPAPSALSFKVKIPPAAHLSLGYGLLPEANVPGAPDVGFDVEVVTADGASKRLMSEDRAPSSKDWADADLELAELAGQEVTLRLITRGREATGQADVDLYRLPEAAAVWSYPVLYSEDAPGKLVVLTVADTLPAYRCSTFGYEKATTPELTRIAGLGTAFERAVSPAPWTLPAFSSMLTGLDPARHRAGERLFGARKWRRPLAQDFTTLAERLRAAGWETMAWINNPYLQKDFGLHQGWSNMVDYGTRSVENASKPAMDDILPLLSHPRGYNRFLFIHLMDPHGPYRPNRDQRSRWLSEGYEGRFEDKMTGEDYLAMCEQKLELTDADKARVGELYDAVIEHTDTQVGRIFDATRKVSRPESYTFLFSSDHGEELFQHGRYEHGHSMYDELLHVPLVVYRPGSGKEGARIKAPVSSHDLAPTVLEIAGLPVPPDWTTRSLLPWAAGETPRDDRLFYGQQMLYGTQRVSVEQDGWKYIYNQTNAGAFEKRAGKPKTRHELFQLRQDPTEQQNLFSDGLDRAQALHEQLALHFAQSLRGRYVLYFGTTDGARHTFSGSLSLPDGSFWMRQTEDLVWPGASGTPGKVSFDSGRGDPRLVGFSASGERALLAFSIDKGGPPVTLDLKIDGAPATPEQVYLAADGAHPGAMPFTAEDKAIATTPEQLLSARAAAGPYVVVALLPQTEELLGENLSGAEDEALKQQLKELGYIH